MEQKARIISAILIGAPLTVLALYYVSTRPNSSKNGFDRTLYETVLSAPKEVTYEGELLRISGRQGHNFVFNDTTPGKFLLYDSSFAVSQSIVFHPDSVGKATHPFRVCVQNGHAYIMSMNTATIADCDLLQRKSVAIDVKDNFNQAACIGSDRFIIRQSVKSDSGIYYHMCRMDANTGLKVNGDQLNKEKMDGGFSNDGMLHFDESLNLMTYVPFYSNTISCFDTNLIPVNTGKTVDTTNNPIIGTIGERNQSARIKWSYTLSAPPVTINRKSCVDQGRLFVCSNLKADNEQEAFYKNDVIDVYQIPACHYLGSFYLPLLRGERCYDFRIFDNNKLVAVYKNKILFYNITFPPKRLI